MEITVEMVNVNWVTMNFGILFCLCSVEYYVLGDLLVFNLMIVNGHVEGKESLIGFLFPPIMKLSNIS